MPKQLFGPTLAGLCAREAPINFGTPFLFLQQLQLWTSNLVHKLGVALQKITFRTKIGGGLSWGALPKILGPLLISATVLARDFKFGIYLRVIEQCCQKQLLGPKLTGLWAREPVPKFCDPYLFLKPLKIVTSNLVHNLGLWSSVVKTTSRTNTDRPEKHPRNFGTPYLFLQPLKVVTSNLVYNLGCGNMIQKLLLRPNMAWVWAWEHPTNLRVLPGPHPRQF